MNVHFENITAIRPSFRENQVLVFKTNLKFKKHIQQLAPVLNTKKGIIRWNVDLDDIDNVLRIETFQLVAQDIIRLVMGAGYICEELPD